VTDGTNNLNPAQQRPAGEANSNERRDVTDGTNWRSESPDGCGGYGVPAGERRAHATPCPTAARTADDYDDDYDDFA